MAKPTTAVVAKTDNRALAFSETKPDWMKGDTHKGSENVEIKDLTIPRLSMVQGLSPERKKEHANYIQGAEDGDIFNTVTRKIYQKPVYIVPVYFRKEVVIWKKRMFGGGFKGVYKTMDEAVTAMGKLPDKLGVDEKTGQTVDRYECLDTAHQFVLVVHADGPEEEAVMSLQKTGLTFSRKFNSLIALAGGDRYSMAYTLDSVYEKKEKGDYYAWKVANAGFVGEQTYNHAEKLYKAVSEGIRDVKYEQDDPVSATVVDKADF